MNNRTKLFGVGVNDLPYPVTKYDIVDCKMIQTWICPFYACWKYMLDRCYNPRESNKSYRDVWVCQSWHKASNFKEWMEIQRWEGNVLDKDLLVPGNKLYSPDTCVYLPSNINTKLFYVPTKNKFGLKGVWYDSQYDKWMATVSKAVDGRGTIGRFKTKEEASSAVLRSEHKFFCRLAEEWGGKLDPRAIQGLLNLAEHRRGMILT